MKKMINIELYLDDETIDFLKERAQMNHITVEDFLSKFLTELASEARKSSFEEAKKYVFEKYITIIKNLADR